VDLQKEKWKLVLNSITLKKNTHNNYALYPLKMSKNIEIPSQVTPKNKCKSSYSILTSDTKFNNIIGNKYSYLSYIPNNFQVNNLGNKRDQAIVHFPQVGINLETCSHDLISTRQHTMKIS
jgi:hypothetical protein